MFKELARVNASMLLIVLISGCAAMHKDRPQPDDYKVEKSILKEDNIKTSGTTESYQLEESNSEFTKLPTKDKRLSPLGKLQLGPQELTERPIFNDNNKMRFTSERLPLPEFVQTVFGELLGLNFSLGEGVQKGKDVISLSLTNAVSKSELYDIASNALSGKGFQTYHKNGIVHISKSKDGKSSPGAIGIGRRQQDIPNSSGEILQIIPYTYNSNLTITKAVSAMTKVKLTSDPLQKLFFVQGPRFEVARVIRLVDMLDLPALTGRVIDILRLENISPDFFINQLNKLLLQEGIKVGPTLDVSFVALNRMNSVIVYSSDQRYTKRVKFWQAELDIALGGDQKRFFVYRPKYSRAEDIAKSIRPFLSVISTNGNNQTAATTSNESGNSNKKSKPSTSLNGPSMTIDENQNALIFYETPQKFNQMKLLLEKLDVLPGQIALDVAIAEVLLSDSVSSGIDWLYDSNANAARSGGLELNSTTGTLSFGGFEGDWQVALNLLDSVTDTRLLSKPYIVVRDGQSATINSGDSVPTISQLATNAQNPNVLNTTVQYQTTGITLQVTPTINAEGIILLQINQSVSTAEPAENINIATPRISNRSLQTEIYAGDGQTVILGGLIQEDTTYTDNGVALLQDIPVLGGLFQNQGDETQRTELMIMITARVIKNMSDLDEIGEKLKKLYSFPISSEVNN